MTNKPLEPNVLENKDDLSTLFTEIIEKAQKVVSAYLQQGKALHETAFLIHLTSFGNSYQALLNKLITDPIKLAQLQMSYWQDYLLLYQHTMQNFWLNKAPTPIIETDSRDKRFQNPIWQEQPFFLFLKQLYLLTAQHLQNLTDEIEETDKSTAIKIKFFIRQLIDVLSPSNFFLTNPEVLQNFLRTGGKTLLKGIYNMLSDLERGDTLLNMTLTDVKAFEVGRNLAMTPGKVIFQNPLIQLIQYQPMSAQVYGKPLLIIPPWINKYYILDLSEHNSLIRWLVNQGYNIFLISWINPDKRYANIDFQDYALQGLLPAFDIIKKVTDSPKINALGFCIGGTLLATAMAYLTTKKANCIESATYLTTLLDFSEPGDIGAFIDKEQFSLLQKEMLQTGYLSGRILKMIFNLLRPNDLIWSYVIKNYLQGEEPLPIDLLFWNSDVTNLPAQMVTTYLREFYLSNQLKTSGSFKIKDTPIDLRVIKNPVYFLSTLFDHIAPWKSTYAGVKELSGPVTFVLGGAGHVAGVVNPPSKNKYGYYTNETLPEDSESWLQTAKENPGSWWTHWEQWLRNYSGDFVSAKQPGGDKIKPLEDAPGTYVLRRLEEIEDSNSE